jgi:cyclopropane fatty-acyl-phospholipid synthase-like methyltransferase
MSGARSTDRYEGLYRDFDSPLMRELRHEAYGEDIGQHSWVRAEELRGDIPRLGLSRASRLLDCGCGPCGPLTFMLATVGCTGTGVDVSASALRAGRARAASLGIAAALAVQQVDLNQPLSLTPASFNAAMALDVVLHLRDRSMLFREIATLVERGGRFLFTDAGVITGAVSIDELQSRSTHGYTQFVPAGWNEGLLASAGLRLLETEDRTTSVVTNASGRLAALQAHRAELEAVWDATEVRAQQEYLETVVALARRRAVSRVMYLAEVQAPTAV